MAWIPPAPVRDGSPSPSDASAAAADAMMQLLRRRAATSLPSAPGSPEGPIDDGWH
jgi:hypothetical protein